MGSLVKCFDVVSMVTEEVTSQFAPIWKVNKESERILKQYCSVLDSISDEFGGISFEVDVDDIKMTISIKMECSDMVLESQTHKYYELAQRAISFGFSQSEEGNLLVEFVFPSIWEKAV